MERTESAERVDLRRTLRAAIANGWIVLLMVVVGAGGAYAWSKSKAKVYSSSAVVRVFDPNDATPSAAASSSRVDPLREVQIEVLYARSPQVSTEVNHRLASTAPAVRSRSITGSTDSDTVTFTVQSAKPAVAQTAAETYAAVFIAERQDAIAAQYAKQSAKLESAVASIRRQISAIDAVIASTPPNPLQQQEPEAARNLDAQRNALVAQSTGLSAQLSDLSLASASRQSDLAIVQPAALPTNPIIPLPRRDAAIGGLIGLLLGLGLVALRVRLRDKVTTSADLAAVLPALSFIVTTPPRLSLLERRRVACGSKLDVVDGRASVREAYGVLRASVLYSDARTPGGSLLVTSSRAGEGKTMIAANLALSLARGGARVVVIDCDLRHPSLHEQFGVDGDVGLATVLTTPTSLRSAVRTVDVGGTKIDVITAGPVVADAADLLIRTDIGDIVEDLKRDHDYVVLDGPPVLPAADTLALAQIADGVLLVVRSGQTKASTLANADAALRRVAARISGAVLVGVRSDRLPPPGTLDHSSPPRWRVAAGSDEPRHVNGNGNGSGAESSDKGDVLIL